MIIGVIAALALAGLTSAPDASSSVAARAVAHKMKRARTVSFVGHGWGPGIGMGQWGDFGYAVRYHETYSQILAHFYGGTTLSPLPSATGDPTVRVVILENLNLTTNIGFDPVVTSPSAFTVTSSSSVPVVTIPTTTLPASTVATTTLPASTAPSTTPTTLATTTLPTTTVPATTTTASTTTAPATTTTLPATGPTSFAVGAGQSVDLRLQANGTWNAYEASSCTGASAAATSGAALATGLVNPVIAPADLTASAPVSGLLTLCRHDGVDEVLRGSVQAYDRSGYARTINVLPLQSYLDGVVPAEESASWGLDGGSVGAPQGEPWGFQALEAQAVAARSYTLASGQSGGWNGYADICDTDQCEAYVGAGYEYAISDAAVAATLDDVLVASASSSSVIDARFSASTGGWTAPSAFPAVPDLGDACVVVGNPLECNPEHTWRAVVSAAAIERHYRSIGQLLSVHVSARNARGALGGRALSVHVVGTRGAVTVSGSAFAGALGLRSDWFAVSRITRGAPVATSPTTTTSTTTSTTGVATTTPGATTTTVAGAGATSTPGSTAPTTTVVAG